MKLQPKDIDSNLFSDTEEDHKLPINWDDIVWFDEDTNLGVVSVKERYGAVNRDGEIIIPLNYDKAMVRFTDGLLAVMKDNKWGFVDANHKVIIPFEYDNIVNYVGENGEAYTNGYSNMGTVKYFSDGHAIVMKEGKMGIINKKNEVVIPLEKRKIVNHSNGIIIVSENGKFGIINFKNEELLPNIYDDLNNIFNNYCVGFGKISDEKIENYNHGDLILDENAIEKPIMKFGVIDVQVNVIVPDISYHAIGIFKNNKAMCFDYHKNEFFAYDTLTKKSIYAPKEMDENEEETKKVNFIRGLIGVDLID